MLCALIIAGGSGARMMPYSEKWHKACLTVCNEPIICRQVRQLLAAGVSDIRVAVNERESQLRHFLRNYPVKFHRIATGGTAEIARQALSGWAGDALVVCADMVFDEQALEKLVCRALPAMLVSGVNERELPRFGVQIEENYIKNIVGQPRKSYAEKAVAGAYYLNERMIKLLAVNPGRMLNVPVGGMPPEQAVLEQTCQTFLDDGGSLLAVSAGFAVDINYPWDLLAANKLCMQELLAAIPGQQSVTSGSVHPTAIIEGRIRLGRGSKIGRNVIVQGDVWIGDNTVVDYGVIIEGSCVIGDNCQIKNGCMVCSGAVIGNNNKIGYCAQFGGLTLDGVCIVHHAELLALVGSHVDIGAGTMTGTLRFDDKSSRIQAGEYANYVYIGDYTRCGVGNVFYPGVMVGSNCALGPGLIIDKDVESNSLLLVEQTVVKKRWGPEKYGW